MPLRLTEALQYDKRRNAGRRGFIAPKKKYAKKKKYSRAPVGLSNKIAVNRMIARQLQNFSETKVLGLNTFTEQGPSPIQPLAQTTYYGMVLGGQPATWSGAWTDLAGMPINQGTGSQQHVGEYVYLKKSTLNCIVDMNTDTSSGPSPPWEVRCIMFKANRKYNPDGTARDPSRSLFLAPNGEEVGHGSSGQSGLSLFMSPTNKRDWTIYRDFKFKLQAPLQGSGSAAVFSQPAGIYENSRQFRFTMPHSKKVKIENNQVENYNARFGIVFYFRPVGHDGSTSRPEISFQGSTAYVDN